MKAVWKNVTLAESDQTIVVEGNHYFPLKIPQFFLKFQESHFVTEL